MPTRLSLLSLAALIFVLSPLARAENVAPADAAAFQSIISAQMEAFKTDDGTRAYSYASPGIKQIFPTAEIFLQMVKKGYQPVYRPAKVTFGEVTTETPDRPTQHVTIVDASGKVWTALYTFEKQADGSWKISGCTLLEVPGENA